MNKKTFQKQKLSQLTLLINQNYQKKNMKNMKKLAKKKLNQEN